MSAAPGISSVGTAVLSSIALEWGLYGNPEICPSPILTPLAGFSFQLFSQTLFALCRKRPVNKPMAILSVLFFLISTSVSSIQYYVKRKLIARLLVGNYAFSMQSSMFTGYTKARSFSPKSLVYPRESSSTMTIRSCPWL
jgi:hypothetical protein